MQASNIIAHRDAVEKLQHGHMCAPVFADLHLSNICNHKCLGCAYKDNLGTDDIPYMNIEDIQKVIHTLSVAGVKAFDFAGGGEPLCIPDIEDAFSYVIKRGASYALITNGLLFTGGLMRQVVQEAAYVRVSLEGAMAIDYANYKQTTKLQQQQVIRNIKKAIDERNQSGSTCEISIKFSVSKSLRGINHYVAGIRLGKRLGVDSVQFKALRHEPEELMFAEKMAEQELLKKVIYETDSSDLVRYWIKPADHVPQCTLNPLHIVVDHNGDCYICCYYYYRGDEHKLGNILSDDFDSFWYGQEHKDKVKAIDPDKCRLVDCKFFKHDDVAKWAFDKNRTCWL